MKQTFVIDFKNRSNSVSASELFQSIDEHYFGAIEVDESRAVEFEEFAKPVLDAWSLGKLTPEQAICKLMDEFQRLYGG